MTEERMRELFREMRDEPVPADSLAISRTPQVVKPVPAAVEHN